MSRAAVRSALTEFFAPPAVTHLAALYASAQDVEGSTFGVSASTSGAVGFPFIERERESPAGWGSRSVTYDVALVCAFRSGKNPGPAMDDYDAFVDSLKDRLRSDRYIGTAGEIMHAGEGDADGNGATIDLRSDLPVVKGNTTRIWTACRFQVVETIEE